MTPPVRLYTLLMVLPLMLCWQSVAAAEDQEREVPPARQAVTLPALTQQQEPSALRTQPSSTRTQGNAELELQSFTVKVVHDDIHITSGLLLKHQEVVRDLLRDGAVMNLTYAVGIERQRTLLANETLATYTCIHQLRHDPLTREFVMGGCSDSVHKRQKQFEKLFTPSLSGLEFIIPLSAPLVSGETYLVRVQVTLQHAAVPPWMEQALFFWSWDVVPPVSFTQEFVY